jgi:hypothetical protein
LLSKKELGYLILTHKKTYLWRVRKMKKLKSFIKTLCLVLIFMFLMPIFALADLVIEPQNDFYERYREHILFLGRGFVANGVDGFVSVKESPDSEVETARLANGESVFIEFSCLYNGEFWGLLYTVESPSYGAGWVKVNEFLVLYDYVAFEEENANELYQYTGDLSEIGKVGP